ncbi:MULTISPECIES: CoA ester lyase [unclassified Sphingomonas]|uniref:HpcH/HpaI aldolase/citrate lyase family protein n=1 Tax=unclassified Sphingomonas TaxID=196159 RepID=UPI0021511061|nr:MULTISPECIES: CoA ester lyase [unclassified Sphingomonas]MCR5869676.1 CoA ester lyase [Sphingomonas sp. J344]UUX98616.1 CoA ester lyase [Sphingomonas sp. J315]
MSKAIYAPPRTALFLPASNPRAIEKAKGLAADMIILDLEDAVKAQDKEAAREAVKAIDGFGDRPFGVRVNGEHSEHWSKDLKAVKKSAATHVVIPKVEKVETIITAGIYSGKPVLAMIETPAGVMNVGPIASASGWGYELAGLIVGTNDLAASLKLPPAAGRAQMALSLQLVVLAARARELWVFDGVFNRLDDPEGLAAECAEGRLLGFDGKSLIHPNQIDIARAAFDPTEAELEEARALVAAATGGAERYKDAMIEEMHVDQAKALLARAGH